MAFEIFQNGTALTAEKLNDLLMEQAVITFVDAAARDNAIPTPQEGMHCYLASTDQTLKYTTKWIELMPGEVSGLTARTILVCTTTTRPSHAAGRVIFETDTSTVKVSNGTAWINLLSQDTGWTNITPATNWTAGTRGSRYRIVNGICYLQIQQVSSAAWANSAVVATLPVAARPATALAPTATVYGNIGTIITINTDGTIVIGAPGAANEGFFCVTSYPLT